MKGVYGSLRGRAGSVADADQSRCAAVDRNHDDCSPLRGHRVPLVRQIVEADVFTGHQLRVPNRHSMAVDRGQRAVPGDVLEADGGEPGHARLLRAANYGFGQWVLRVSLDGRGHCQNLLLGHCSGLNRGDFRFAPGQRSRLVHDHDLDSSSRFDCGRWSTALQSGHTSPP